MKFRLPRRVSDAFSALARHVARSRAEKAAENDSPRIRACFSCGHKPQLTDLGSKEVAHFHCVNAKCPNPLYTSIFDDEKLAEIQASGREPFSDFATTPTIERRSVEEALREWNEMNAALAREQLRDVSASREAVAARSSREVIRSKSAQRSRADLSSRTSRATTPRSRERGES